MSEHLDGFSLMRDLNKKAEEIGKLADLLAAVQRDLEPVEDEHDTFVSDFVAGMWEQYIDGKGKWPGEEVRLLLARRQMPPELYGRFTALKKKKDRLTKRISVLKTEIEATRSLLSAAKAEMEATR